jgi:hypothetical protein
MKLLILTHTDGFHSEQKLKLSAFLCFSILIEDLVTPNISACRNIDNVLLIKVLLIYFMKKFQLLWSIL